MLHCANFYGLPVTVTDILKLDNLTSIGDIPYSFVHFEQDFCIIGYSSRLSNGMGRTDNQFKTRQKSYSREYSRSAQSVAPKSREIQSVYPSLHGELLLRMPGKLTHVCITQGWHVSWPVHIIVES